MLKTLKTTALAALVGLGTLAAMPAAANAGSVTLHFGDQGAAIQVGHGGRHYDRRPQRGRECTPNRALNKAERLGIRNVRVRNMNRNVITVRGRDRRGPVLVTFARAPGCPVIR